MSAHAHALTASATAASDPALLYPWGLGEIRAGLALCPPGAFHITGLRLERLPDGGWWGDLVGYRDDLGAPFIWPGFRIRRGHRWDVTPPPYLVDLDGVWRALAFGAVQRLAAVAVGDPFGVHAPALFVAVERPSGMPGPGHAGGERVVPTEPTLAGWMRLARRYRLAAELARHRTALVVGAGAGARTVARLARRAIAVHASRDVVEYTARSYRAPRLGFAVADEGRLPFASEAFDLVVTLETDDTVAGAGGLNELTRVLHPGGRLIVGGDRAPLELSALGERFDDVETVTIDAGEGVGGPDTILVARGRTTGAAADWRRRGSELLVEGRVAEALPIFAAVLDREPDNVTALVGAAHCALVVDHTQAARRLLGRVLALDPSHAGARAALAELDRAVTA